MKKVIVTFLILSIFCFGSCSEDDPKDDSLDDTSTETVPRDACLMDALKTYETTNTCEAKETDYIPGGEDTWEACITDDNMYHKIEESISSIARVNAYDSIGELLWNNPNVPTVTDFINARDLLDSEEGLGSRIDRRYDIHYDAPEGDAKCNAVGAAEANPDYCVGPGKLRPIINAAFSSANEGGNMQLFAEQIHSAIQWFLYVSPLKEATTCTTKAKDCDSAWAYYTGGTDRDKPVGLAREINMLSSEAHNRAYDGALAVRCWRDIDGEETATNTDMRDLAIAQYDAALIHGMSILVRQRFLALANCSDEDEKEAALGALKILVPLFDLETRKRDATAADVLLAEIKKTASEVDVTGAVNAIDSTYKCP